MIVIVLGASPNPRRYSNKATELLSNNGHEVIPVGVKCGEINCIEIIQNYPERVQADTITIYLSIENQEKYYDLILNNLPRRIIFNPGTYNPDFQQKLISKGVNVVNDCTLVMVNRGDF